MSRNTLAVLVSLLIVPACGDDTSDEPGLRLNQLQALGTHNSYHTLASSAADPRLDYVHEPLAEQLDMGVRHFEIDVHRDAATGEIRVYHIKTIDEASTCATWAECLGELRRWSDAHPHHHLLVVLVEPKDDLARVLADAGKDPAVTGELLWDGHVKDLQEALAATWPDRVLTPRDVQGSAPTLRDAVTTVGWPTIDETRQRIALVLNDSGALRDEYRQVAIAERRLFVLVEPSEDDAAFISADDPVADAGRIASAVQAGFIARTRADAETEVDPEITAAALASGVQLVSTDYPTARTDGAHPGYRIPWPGTPEHPSRCNPVTAPPDCRAEEIE